MTMVAKRTRRRHHRELPAYLHATARRRHPGARQMHFFTPITLPFRFTHQVPGLASVACIESHAMWASGSRRTPATWSPLQDSFWARGQHSKGRQRQQVMLHKRAGA